MFLTQYFFFNAVVWIGEQGPEGDCPEDGGHAQAEQQQGENCHHHTRYPVLLRVAPDLVFCGSGAVFVAGAISLVS